MYLSLYCSKGNIMHELLHVLGVFHEQSRNDRDDYIFVNYANIRNRTFKNTLLLLICREPQRWLQKIIICSEGVLSRRFFFQKVLFSESPMFRSYFVQKVLCSEGHIFRSSYVHNVLCSVGPMFRMSYVQKVPYSEHPMFRMSFVQ